MKLEEYEELKKKAENGEQISLTVPEMIHYLTYDKADALSLHIAMLKIAQLDQRISALEKPSNDCQ